MRRFIHFNENNKQETRNAYNLLQFMLLKTPAERADLYKGYDVKMLAELLDVAHALCLVKTMEINDKQLDLAAGYPANQEDIDTILEIDAKKRSLADNPAVRNLEAIIKELTPYVELSLQMKRSYTM